MTPPLYLQVGQQLGEMLHRPGVGVLLAGPRYIGKLGMLQCLREQRPTVVVNLARYQTKPAAHRDECVRRLIEQAEDPAAIVVFDRVEFLTRGERGFEPLRDVLGCAQPSLWVVNLPWALVQCAGLAESWLEPVKLRYEDHWKPGMPHRQQAEDLGLDDDQLDAICGAIGYHPYVGHLLLDAIEAGRLRPPTDAAALVSVWRELASGPLRLFFQERSEEIRQDRALMEGCRALFRHEMSETPATWTMASGTERAAYLRLAEWGIVTMHGSGSRAGTIDFLCPLFRAWLGQHFAADLYQACR